MKKIVVLLCFMLGLHAANSQKNGKPQELFYYLDANFKGTNSDKQAKYFMHSVKENDTSYIFDTYNMFGPVISIEHYKDEKADVLHGEATYFNGKGTRDSIVHYLNGLEDGQCLYFNDTGRVYLEKTYAMGKVINTIDRIKQADLDDAAWKLAHPDTTGMIGMESEFPDATVGWKRYLEKNIKYPERAMNANRSGQVRIQFIVDKDGHVYDISLVTSVEFSLDQEAMRLIKISPDWRPAIQFGKKVKSYKIQPINFRLQ